MAKETVLECVQEATSGLLKVPTNRLQHLLALGLRRNTNPIELVDFEVLDCNVGVPVDCLQ